MSWVEFFFGSKNPQERRCIFRQKTRNLVLVSTPPESKMMNLVDLSESGAQITSSKQLRKNKTIYLKINLAEQNREVLVTAKVAWVKAIASPRTSLYRVGVSFMEISQEAWMKLHSYMFHTDKAA